MPLRCAPADSLREGCGRVGIDSGWTGMAVVRWARSLSKTLREVERAPTLSRAQEWRAQRARPPYDLMEEGGGYVAWNHSDP